VRRSAVVALSRITVVALVVVADQAVATAAAFDAAATAVADEVMAVAAKVA